MLQPCLSFPGISSPSSFSKRASEDLLLGVVSSVVEISSLELLGPQQVSRGKEKQKNSFRQACMFALSPNKGIPHRAGA